MLVVSGRLCQLLIKAGAKINARDCLLGETALHKAVWSNAIDNVAALVRFRADVNAVDTASGDTALHKAASLPNVDRSIWNVLMAAKARTDVTNFDKMTPFEKAKRSKNKLAEILLKASELVEP